MGEEWLLCLDLERPFAGDDTWMWMEAGLGEYTIGDLSAAWYSAKPFSEICFTILMNC